jgi:hypothetical protein
MLLSILHSNTNSIYDLNFKINYFLNYFFIYFSTELTIELPPNIIKEGKYHILNELFTESRQ